MTETRIAPVRLAEWPPAQAHTRRRELPRRTRIRRALAPRAHGYQLVLLAVILAVWEIVVFVLNALSYIGIIAVLVHWKREHRKSTLPAERFLSARSDRSRPAGPAAVQMTYCTPTLPSG